MRQAIHDILHQYWGYDSFRPLQEDIILSVLAGRDTLGLMATGGGKSLTFQVPALAMDGVCIVITPLIALMKDQVDNLRKRGIKAAMIASGMTRRERNVAFENCVNGAYKFLYVSPERLSTEMFQNRLREMNVRTDRLHKQNAGPGSHSCPIHTPGGWEKHQHHRQKQLSSEHNHQ